jgi:hypothetical protein
MHNNLKISSFKDIYTAIKLRYDETMWDSHTISFKNAKCKIKIDFKETNPIKIYKN